MFDHVFSNETNKAKLFLQLIPYREVLSPTIDENSKKMADLEFQLELFKKHRTPI
jgi:hypothetical protein